MDAQLNLNHTLLGYLCEECRAEARMKKENREKEDAGLMELGVTHSTRERQRERNTQKTLFQNNALTLCTYVCVQCTLYTSPLED